MNDEQERNIFLVLLLDVFLLIIVLACCVKNGICCFRKKDGGEKSERKGVEEGLHQMFKLAMYEKLEADKRAARFPSFTIKTVQQQQEAIHYDHQSPYQALKPFKLQQEQQNGQASSSTDISETNSATNSPITRNKMKGVEECDEEEEKDYDDNVADTNPYMLKLSLYYSNGSLVLTLHELFGVPSKESGGYDLVRISIALLPEKQHKRQTRSLFVGTEGPLVFGEIFRFFDVNPDSLLYSFFRFRLFADLSTEAECCIGEMFVELCGVLDCEEGFGLWKEFQRKNLTFRQKSADAEHSDDDNNINQ